MRCEWLLRQATEQDLGAVLAVMRRSPTAPQWTPGQCRQILVRLTHGAHRRIVLLTEQESEVTGFAVVSALCSVAPPEAELENIAVSPDWRGRGVGASLVAAAITWAAAQRADCLRLEVRAGNTSAVRLYRSMGFLSVGTRPRYYAAPVEDALCMEREVK